MKKRINTKQDLNNTVYKSYCIKNPNGRLLLWSVRTTASECKTSFINNYKPPKYPGWKQWKIAGYKCVPISIMENTQFN